MQFWWRMFLFPNKPDGLILICVHKVNFFPNRGDDFLSNHGNISSFERVIFIVKMTKWIFFSFFAFSNSIAPTHFKDRAVDTSRSAEPKFDFVVTNVSHVKPKVRSKLGEKFPSSSTVPIVVSDRIKFPAVFWMIVKIICLLFPAFRIQNDSWINTRWKRFPIVPKLFDQLKVFQTKFSIWMKENRQSKR